MALRTDYSPNSEPSGGRLTTKVYAIDMIEHAKAINAITQEVVDLYGADPTGATFSDTAVAAAKAALGSNPGILVFGAGTYKLANTITLGRGQGMIGQGVGTTLINYTGSGDCLYIRDAASPPKAAGPVRGFGIDGSTAGAGSVGIHAGDVFLLRMTEVAISGFDAAGCIGLRLHNVLSWMERAHIEAEIDSCTTCVVFDVTGSGGNSFGYSTYNLSLSADANQNGVVIQHGAAVYNGSLRIGGNFHGGVTNTGAVLTLGADNSDTVYLAGHLDIQVEGMDSGVAHKTIQKGTAVVVETEGILNFRNAGLDFAAGNAATTGGFRHYGRINVDTNLGWMGGGQVAAAHGAVTGCYGFADVGDVYLSAGNYFAWTLPNGATTITLHTDGMLGNSNAFTVDLFIAQPTSGAAGTLTWPGTVTWLRGAPTLSTTNNAVDHIRLIAPYGSGSTVYYGHHINDPVGVKVSVPSTATSTGVVGQWAADNSFFYVCTATNTWRRVAIASW